MTSKYKYYKYWIPAILYMALLFYLSSRPAPAELDLIPVIAKLKLVHIIEYGILYFLLWYAITKTTAYSKIEVFILALFATILYGLTDEFHQIFVAGRSAKLIDIVANGVGGVLAGLGIKLRNQSN
ncbi:MAG: VanZ family protein [bacterium]